MKVYLVEEYIPGMEFDENSLIVALTPEVCYHLDKARLKYSIIEDYYDQAELLATDARAIASSIIHGSNWVAAWTGSPPSAKIGVCSGSQSRGSNGVTEPVC